MYLKIARDCDTLWLKVFRNQKDQQGIKVTFVPISIPFIKQYLPQRFLIQLHNCSDYEWEEWHLIYKHNASFFVVAKSCKFLRSILYSALSVI